MKSILSCFAVALFLGAAIPSAQAQQPVPLDFFYDNLAPYGSWQEVGDYGYCWQPYDVDPGWQPYSNGRWVYTDVGWTWDSYEPFGWAVYHYGRWANLNGIGWIWVPGNEWGPGWVSWRHSPRYVGWAPLPPEALFLRAIGFSGWVDDYYNIGPNNYRFVENQNFGSPRLNSVFIDQRQNMQIIHQTTNITNITYVNNVVYNGGLGYDQQARQSAEPIHRYKLDRRQSFDGDPRHQTADHLRSQVRGDSLSMLALPFSGQASAPPPKLSQRIGNAEINHGWNNAGSPAEVTAIRERLKSNVSVPEQLPSKPRFERPAAPKMPREEVRIAQPAEQPPKATPNRNDTPRNPNTPPMTPEKRPLVSDLPPASIPGANRGPIPGSQRPADSPNPGGRNKMSDPRPEIVPPPQVERKPENKTIVPPQQRMLPKPPETTPQRPEIVRPVQHPQAPPMVPPNVAPVRPESGRPFQRPQLPPTAQPPQPAPSRQPQQRPESQRPQFRPAPAAPATPLVPAPPPVVQPVPLPPTAPPSAQPPMREKQRDRDNPAASGRKKSERPPP